MVTLPSSSSWIKWCAKLAVGRVLTTTRTRRLRTPADTDAPPDIVCSWLCYYGDHVGGAYLSHDIRGVAGSTRLHGYSYRWAFYSVNSYPACSSQEVPQRGKVGAGRLVYERAYINCVCKCVSVKILSLPSPEILAASTHHVFTCQQLGESHALL